MENGDQNWDPIADGNMLFIPVIGTCAYLKPGVMFREIPKDGAVRKLIYGMKRSHDFVAEASRCTVYLEFPAEYIPSG